MTKAKSNGRELNGFVIERGVPLPLANPRCGRADAIRNLAVGESILFKDTTTNYVGATARTIRQREADKETRKYVTRTVTGGVRIWRTA